MKILNCNVIKEDDINIDLAKDTLLDINEQISQLVTIAKQEYNIDLYRSNIILCITEDAVFILSNPIIDEFETKDGVTIKDYNLRYDVTRPVVNATEVHNINVTSYSPHLHVRIPELCRKINLPKKTQFMD